MISFTIDDLVDIRALAQKLYFEREARTPKEAVWMARKAFVRMKLYFNGKRQNTKKTRRTKKDVEGKSRSESENRNDGTTFKVRTVEIPSTE